MKKKMTPFVTLCLVFGLFTSTQIFAQIEVSNDNNVGIESVDPDSKLNVKNTLREKGFRVHSDFDAPKIYGIENRMQGNSTNQAYGMRTTFLGTGFRVYGAHNLINKAAPFKYGFYNQITGNGATELLHANYNSLNGDYDKAYGMFNKIIGNGDFVTGVHNTLTGTAVEKSGTYSYFSGTSDNAFGIHNQFNATNKSKLEFGMRNVLHGSKQAGSYGVKKGLENYILGKDFNEVYGTTSEIFSTSDNTTVIANKNYINSKSNGSTYGTRNEFQLNNSQTAGNVYGTYSIFNGTGSPYSIVGNQTTYNVVGSNQATFAYGSLVNINSGPTYSYGVHSTVPSGANHYAGYFSGTVYANNEILSASDQRLKEDINSIGSALSSIKKLQPKKYKIKRERNNSDIKDHFGFIAQELKEVYPELVQLVPQPGKMKERIISKAHVQIGPEGEKISIPEKKEKYQDMDGEPMYAINYIGLIPQLVSAIQEQDEKIESIEDGIDQFDEKIAEDMASKLINQENRIKALEATIAKLIDCADCDELKDLKENGFDLELDNFKMRVYPNPTREYANLEIISEKKGVLDIRVFNAQGQLLIQEEIMISLGVNVHKMEFKNWTFGTYFINTTFEGVTQSEKVIVE